MAEVPPDALERILTWEQEGEQLLVGCQLVASERNDRRILPTHLVEFAVTVPSVQNWLNIPGPTPSAAPPSAAVPMALVSSLEGHGEIVVDPSLVLVLQSIRRRLPDDDPALIHLLALKHAVDGDEASRRMLATMVEDATLVLARLRDIE